MASLPLLAFQHHVGSLLVDPAELEYICELGQGALGLVEKGRMQADGKVVTVVVKSYKPSVVASPEDFRELLMEAGKLARLHHPCVFWAAGRGFALCCLLLAAVGCVYSTTFTRPENT